MFDWIWRRLNRAQIPEPCTVTEAPFAGDEKVTSVLSKTRQKFRVAGIGAAVVRSGGLVSMGVAGWRKLGDSTAVTTDDLWHLGSNTKALTAMAAACLVEAGKLEWDTAIEYAFPTISKTWSGVTLDHCLTHRAGTQPNIDWRAQTSRTMAVNTITSQPPLHQASSRVLYSNAGYVVAGSLMEIVSGDCWENTLKKEVLDPLGISCAGFGGMGTSGQVDQPWGHGADGRVLGNGPAADNPAVLGPAGTVHMSLEGWGKFISDQLCGLRGQSALLPSSSYKHLHEVPTGSTDTSHARGWLVVPRTWAKGHASTHAGSNTMHYSVVWIAPNIDLAVLVCCNSGAGRDACDEAATELIRHYT